MANDKLLRSLVASGADGQLVQALSGGRGPSISNSFGLQTNAPAARVFSRMDGLFFPAGHFRDRIMRSNATLEEVRSWRQEVRNRSLRT